MLSAAKQTDARVLLSASALTSVHALCMELGDLIKQRRKHLGISQRTLASQMGVNPSAVAHWENNATRPTTDKLPLLKQALGILDHIEPSGSQPLQAQIVQSSSEIALLALWRGLDDDERDLFIRLLSHNTSAIRKV